jgi:hypothetical protein
MKGFGIFKMRFWVFLGKDRLQMWNGKTTFKQVHNEAAPKNVSKMFQYSI